jgi:hypothetical protein
MSELNQPATRLTRWLFRYNAQGPLRFLMNSRLICCTAPNPHEPLCTVCTVNEGITMTTFGTSTSPASFSPSPSPRHPQRRVSCVSDGYHLLLMLPLMLLTSCGEKARNQAHSVQVEGSVTSPEIRLELENTISGHALPFGLIQAISVDESGRVYIADTQFGAQEVLVIAPDGQLLRRIGGRGSGPGQFTGLIGTLAWLDGQLLTVDGRQRRLARFDTAGNVMRSDVIPRGIAIPSTLFSADSLVYGYGLLPAPVVIGSAANPPPPRPAPEVQYTTIFPQGDITILSSLQDSVPWPRSLDCMSPDGEWVYPLPLPFHAWGPLRTFLPGGYVAMASRDSFRIDIVNATTGTRERTIVLDFPRYPLRDVDWNAQREVEEFRKIERETGRLLVLPDGTRCPIELMRPEYPPPVRAIIADENGRLWVEISDQDGFALVAVDLQGHVLAQARMPKRDFRVAPYVRGARLYMVSIDHLDVQSVEVYSINWVQ